MPVRKVRREKGATGIGWRESLGILRCAQDDGKSGLSMGRVRGACRCFAEVGEGVEGAAPFAASNLEGAARFDDAVLRVVRVERVWGWRISRDPSLRSG